MQGYLLIIAEPDERENPLSYLYGILAKQGKQYDRMYLPRVTGGGALLAAIELAVAAIANANRLLAASVGTHAKSRPVRVGFGSL
jgi:hypothetical protein